MLRLPTTERLRVRAAASVDETRQYSAKVGDSEAALLPLSTVKQVTWQRDGARFELSIAVRVAHSRLEIGTAIECAE